jgi:hypothetical protein
MFLFCASRNGVSAKEIQRITGVTYKTAWRMGHEIRKYMGWVDGDRPLGGEGGPVVEVDKTFLGGHDKMGWGDKHIVLGAVERGGQVLTRPIPTRLARHVIPELRDWIAPKSRVMSDAARSLGCSKRISTTLLSITSRKSGFAATFIRTPLRPSGTC